MPCCKQIKYCCKSNCNICIKPKCKYLCKGEKGDKGR